MKESSKYYPAFDYLRIVLVLIVAFAHSGITVWSPAGNFAVQVFFSLSGWLIGGILLRSSPGDLPRFYFNRAARIWLPYFLAIALLIIASLLKEKVTSKWLEIFLYDVTFVYNLFGPPQLAAFGDAMPLRATGNHFWSICAEEQFYLLAPLLITMAGARSIWFWCIVAVAVLASPFWNYFGSISLGVLAAVIRTKAGDWHTRNVAIAGLFAVAVATLAATYFGVVPYRLGAPVASIAIVLFLAQAGHHSSLATFLGGMSYPMYLNHWIGVFAANAIFAEFGMMETFICHVSGVFLSLGAAASLYLTVDLVIRKHRDKRFSDRTGKSVAAWGFALVTIGIIGGLIITRV
jgi:peptidoglycan/LPS O-acetylase OafA/YrhL